MAAVLVDTSATYALVNRHDRHHAAARAALESLGRARSEPILTNFLVAESHALILARLGDDLARQWLRTLVWRIERVTPEDEERARGIVLTYKDKTFSYTDATSFALMERLRVKRAFSFDPHFRQYGIEVVPGAR